MTGTAAEVFGAFLRLGCTSFGGPAAHLGYFRSAFVERRGWLTDAELADRIALSQFLPGPGSSQVCIAIGLHRAGWAGALAAWIAFTLPSALLMLAFAAWVGSGSRGIDLPWLHGLQLIAIAVVAHAVWTMARSLAPDLPRTLILLVAAAMAILLQNAFGQIGAILFGAAAGLLLPRATAAPRQSVEIPAARFNARRRVGAVLIATALLLLVLLPLLVAAAGGARDIAFVHAMYRAGALVFGGGHVVLPLLQQAVVDTGWIDPRIFLAGYGAAQAMPGPVFTFAAYLGAIAGGNALGIACLFAIFLPGTLLMVGTLPFWELLRRMPVAAALLRGVNAAVVGLLLAALVQLLGERLVGGALDAALVIAALLLLFFTRLPPWAIVIGGAGLAQLLATISG